jgi:hypothetical protein
MPPKCSPLPKPVVITNQELTIQHKVSSIDKPPASHPPVSSLLYSVFYTPPIPPALPPLPILVPSGLRGHEPFMQNKPNFKIGKMYLNPCHKKHYAPISPYTPEKNKPKQTQSNIKYRASRIENHSP